MVYIIVTSCFPASKGSEVGKRYLEVYKKFPPDRTLAKEIVQNAVKATGDGIISMGVNEVKKGKFVEAMDRITKNMMEYADIEGFSFSIDTYLTVVEAMGIIGLKPPE